MALIAKRVPSGASVSMMDLSVEAEAFGSQIRVSDDEVPTVIGSIITDEEEDPHPGGCSGDGQHQPGQAIQGGYPRVHPGENPGPDEGLLPGASQLRYSSGYDIPPLSNWENIDSFFQAVSE